MSHKIVVVSPDANFLLAEAVRCLNAGATVRFIKADEQPQKPFLLHTRGKRTGKSKKDTIIEYVASCGPNGARAIDISKHVKSVGFSEFVSSYLVDMVRDDKTLAKKSRGVYILGTKVKTAQSMSEFSFA